jgi:hypothetical protein
MATARIDLGGLPPNVAAQLQADNAPPNVVASGAMVVCIPGAQPVAMTLAVHLPDVAHPGVHARIYNNIAEAQRSAELLRLAEDGKAQAAEPLALGKVAIYHDTTT